MNTIVDPSFAREYSREEYVKAKAWLQEHNCWDEIKDQDGFSIVYYYWYKIDRLISDQQATKGK